jgi:3alpha(or 20beta)-hydroxysteroid dehydrogenase
VGGEEVVGRLDGKVALITGAAGGMGLAASRLFVEEGARVVMTDVAEDAGRAAAEEIGQGAAFTRADVSTSADAEAMVRSHVSSSVSTTPTSLGSTTPALL